MEFQFGAAYVRILSDLKHGFISIKIIAPISDEQMQVSRVFISRIAENFDVHFEHHEYFKGDKDEEKSALNL